MKKKLALLELEKAVSFYIDFLIYESTPLSIKTTKKKLKNLISRFNDNDLIPIDTSMLNNNLSIFFVIRNNIKSETAGS